MFLKIRLLLLLLFLPGMLLYATPAYALDDPFNYVCKNSSNSSSPVCAPVPASKQNPILHTIKVATDLLLVVTGAAAVIFILLGSFNLITSSGNPERIKKGREMVVYSLVGVAIASLAWVITTFLISQLAK